MEIETTERLTEGIRPLFGSPAGKGHLAKKLVPMFPEHRRYVEAFAGGAAVFFSKEPSAEEVLGDVNDENVWLYRTVQRITEGQIKALKRKNWTSSKKVFDRLKASDGSDPLDKLYRRLYVRTFSFKAEGVGHGGRNVGWSPSTEGRTYGIVARLAKLKERLKHAEVVQQEAWRTVLQFDGPDTFFFLDPPWPKFDQRVGEIGYDPRPLMEALREAQGKFLLIYQGPGFDELAEARGFTLLEPNWSTMATNRAGGTQGAKPYKLIVNYATSIKEARVATLDLEDPARIAALLRENKPAGFLASESFEPPSGPVEVGDLTLKVGKPLGPYPDLMDMEPDQFDSIPTVALKRFRDVKDFYWVPLQFEAP